MLRCSGVCLSLVISAFGKKMTKAEKTTWQMREAMLFYMSAWGWDAPCKLNNVRRKNAPEETLLVSASTMLHVCNVVIRWPLKNFWEQARIGSNIWFVLLWSIDTKLLRVWSWLRMNAGGVLNTCKSNGTPWTAASAKGMGRLVANGWVTREQPALRRGTTAGNGC